MKLHEKLIKLIQIFTSDSQTAFAQKIGMSQSTFRGYLNEKGQDKLKFVTLKRILETFPEINRDWLLFGEGPMLSNPLKADINPEYEPLAQCLKLSLKDRNLSTTHANFAKAGDITEDELQAILEARMQPTIETLRKWGVKYRMNLNFMLARIGNPLQTREQYEENGPLMDERIKDGEAKYPGAARSPDYGDSPYPEIIRTETPEKPRTIEEKPQLPKSIPLVGLAECGIEGWSDQMEMAATTQIPDFHAETIAAMTIGDSMEPAGIRPGNIVYADPRLKPRSGDIVYVARRNGHGEGSATVKIYQEKKDGWLHLCGWLPKKHGGDRQKDFCIKENLDYVDVIAPVVMIRKRAE